MSDTPRTDVKRSGSTHFMGDWVDANFAAQIERELAAANDRIQSLIEERDRANRLADWKWNLRDEFELLLGTDKIEEGIEAVKELKRRIIWLEEVAEDLVEQSDIYIRRQEWRKAKEAKL